VYGSVSKVKKVNDDRQLLPRYLTKDTERLHITYCTLYIAYCHYPLHIAYGNYGNGKLYIAYFIWHILYCIFHMAYFILHISYCILSCLLHLSRHFNMSKHLIHRTRLACIGLILQIKRKSMKLFLNIA
jgi:hypothetical protein